MIRDNLNRIYDDNLVVDAIIDVIQPELDRQSQTIRNHFSDAFPIIATSNGISKWERILNILPTSYWGIWRLAERKYTYWEEIEENYELWSDFENEFETMDDPTAESIEFRRQRIINRLSNNAPFTERALQELLSRTTNTRESPFAGTWKTVEENFAYWEDIEQQFNLWSDLEQASETMTSAWSYVLDYRNYKLDIFMYRPSRNWINELNFTLQQMIPANIVWEIHLSNPLWSTVEEDYYLWSEIEDKYYLWTELEDEYKNG